jgi:hypothetical protein
MTDYICNTLIFEIEKVCGMTTFGVVHYPCVGIIMRLPCKMVNLGQCGYGKIGHVDGVRLLEQSFKV